MPTTHLRRLAAVSVLAAAAAACTSTAAPSDPDVPLAVVADQPVADLVRRVGGDRIAVQTIVPVGADSHTYEPTPSDVAALVNAEAYIESGAGLNPTVTGLALANLPEGTSFVQLASLVPPGEIIYTDSEEQIAAHGHGHDVNAHFWPDPVYAALYTERIAAELGRIDPDGSQEFIARADDLLRELAALDSAILDATATIPDEHRLLVVYHDAWSYFGRRYELPVVGAIQPTDFSEPSAAEVTTMIAEIERLGVPAFFGSEVFPSDVLEAIEESTGATYVGDLSDDVLPGEAGAPEHSYVGMMLANARAIVGALGGDASILDRDLSTFEVDPSRIGDARPALDEGDAAS